MNRASRVLYSRSHPPPIPLHLQDPQNTCPKPGNIQGSRDVHGSNEAPPEPASSLCWCGGTHSRLELRKGAVGCLMPLYPLQMQNGGPGSPLGCSPYRTALAVGPRTFPSCVTPSTGSLHGEDGRNKLRMNGPKDGREKTLMWELEKQG